jgi:hypothetical protein
MQRETTALPASYVLKYQQLQSNLISKHHPKAGHIWYILWHTEGSISSHNPATLNSCLGTAYTTCQKPAAAM